MGIGDNIMATGMARGAAARGRRIAFGDGKSIRWDQHSAAVFQGNRNIAPRGSERDVDIEWVPFYKGNRIYNSQDAEHQRWIWNYDFRTIPGEIFFTREEVTFGARAARPGYVVIEPNVPLWKSVAPNKQWPADRYNEVARRLIRQGLQVVQLNYRNAHVRLEVEGVRHVDVPTFRHAIACLVKAGLFIGPEGGMHHAAAAVRIPAVVLFGGFIPPRVTGYDFHTNLTGGAEACGNYTTCDHCKAAMRAISVDEVSDAAENLLKKAA